MINLHTRDMLCPKRLVLNPFMAVSMEVQHRQLCFIHESNKGLKEIKMSFNWMRVTKKHEGLIRTMVVFKE